MIIADWQIGFYWKSLLSNYCLKELKLKKILNLGCFFLVLILFSNVNASTIFYNDETTFLGASGVVNTEDFESGTVGESWNGLDWGDFSTNITNEPTFAVHSIVKNSAKNNSQSLYYFGTSGTEITFNFDTTIYSFGFSTTDIATIAGVVTHIPEMYWTLTTSTGDNNTWILYNPVSFTEDFFGLVSDIGFTNVTFSMQNISADLVYIDDIYYKKSASSPSPTPEPTTLLLFGIGLLGFAGVSRKK